MRELGMRRVGEQGPKQRAQQGGELWGSEQYPRVEGEGEKIPPRCSRNVCVTNRSILRPV